MAARTYYNTNTGEIMFSYSGFKSHPIYSEANTDYIDDEYYSQVEYYIDLQNLNQPTLKGDLPIAIDKQSITADGVDKSTITGIPVDTTYRLSIRQPPGSINGVVSDGIIEITSEYRFIYNLTLTHIKYLPLTITIEAI